jgi:creatinine amidohydrolase
MYELETLTAPALRRLIDAGAKTVVVPFGSIEHQHGHLPLGADALLADAVGRAVADRLDAVLAPTIRVGDAERHMRGTGTLTLRSATLTEVAVEVGESLVRQGFRVIALVSTHGGNRTALRTAAARLNQMRDDIVASVPDGDVGRDPGTHSGAWLTSVMLALRPELVDLAAGGAELADELRTANSADGAVHLERFVSSIVAAVRAAADGLEARTGAL